MTPHAGFDYEVGGARRHRLARASRSGRTSPRLRARRTHRPAAGVAAARHPAAVCGGDAPSNPPEDTSGPGPWSGDRPREPRRGPVPGRNVRPVPVTGLSPPVAVEGAGPFLSSVSPSATCASHVVADTLRRSGNCATTGGGPPVGCGRAGAGPAVGEAVDFHLVPLRAAPCGRSGVTGRATSSTARWGRPVFGAPLPRTTGAGFGDGGSRNLAAGPPRGVRAAVCGGTPFAAPAGERDDSTRGGGSAEDRPVPHFRTDAARAVAVRPAPPRPRAVRNAAGSGWAGEVRPVFAPLLPSGPPAPLDAAGKTPMFM